MKSIILAALLVLSCDELRAFEVKGYVIGADISSVDTKGCTAVKNADSGVPGFSCQTTLGGDSAELRLLVFEDKVVGAIFNVKNALMKPVLDALSDKYGRPAQRNRFMEDYSWASGSKQLVVKERRIDRGYDVISYDRDLLQRAQDANKNKAKGDI